IKLSDEFAQELGVRKLRYEITFDRLLSSSRQQCEMMDLDNFIFKFLLSKAKSYSFGGLSATSLGGRLDGSVVVCSYLRWRNSVGARQRQELLAWQVDAAGVVVVNSAEFGDWLKVKTEFRLVETDKELNKMLFGHVEAAAEKILKLKSNQFLHPEGAHPVAAIWLEK